MSADEFWRNQLRKNESGAPKYTVYTDPDTPEEEFMSAWINKWHEQFAFFNNEGCGCCVNIYEFDVPQEAMDELANSPIEVNLYEELHQPVRAGSPSSFREFARLVEQSNHKHAP